MDSLGSQGRPLFVSTWVAVVALMVLSPSLTGNDFTFGTTTLLFWLVVIAAGLCVITSVAVVVVAHRRNLPELGFVSLWFLVLSVLPLVHGLTAPGVLYGQTETFNSAVFLAGPLGAIAGAPIVLRGRFGTAAARHWVGFHRTGVALLLSLALVMLIWPNLIVTPAFMSQWAILTALPTAAIAASYSWRHLQFAQISGQRRYLIIFFGFAFTGVANLVWLSPVPFGPVFWFAHAFEVVGVLFGTVGSAFVFWRHKESSDLLAPILVADPLVALDLGLDPSVDAYMKLLDSKDVVTRDHAVRTAEAVVQVAASLGLTAGTIRDAGIAAVLHDIGKLGIPDQILNKPGRLTDDEFAVMKTHTTLGGNILQSNPGLRGVAHLVLSHHERLDGGGYPQQLAGDEIPIAARIIAVCDAFDAMAHDRPYRHGMGAVRAMAVLREHAGSQWDPLVVAELIRLTEHGLIRSTPQVLDHLGRHSSTTAITHDLVMCGCLAALPPEVVHEFS